MRILNFVFLALALSALTNASAAEKPILITIKDHKFSPTEIHLPANQRVDITVKNEDSAPEEFESPGLKVEKVIPGNSQLVVHIKPIAPGRYTFVGEYHEKSARGLAVVE
jgi:plastocyanin domain-containing protein